MNEFGTVTTSEFGTQSDKPNNMWNELKHVETHEYINDWWTLWIEPQLSLFVFVVSLLCC